MAHKIKASIAISNFPHLSVLEKSKLFAISFSKLGTFFRSIQSSVLTNKPGVEAICECCSVLCTLFLLMTWIDGGFIINSSSLPPHFLPSLLLSYVSFYFSPFSHLAFLEGSSPFLNFNCMPTVPLTGGANCMKNLYSSSNETLYNFF